MFPHGSSLSLHAKKHRQFSSHARAHYFKSFTKARDGGYRCLQCPKTSRSYSAINMHNLQIHNLKQCAFCTQGFSSMRLLRIHKLARHHRKVQPLTNLQVIQCDFCSRSFAHAKTAENHKRNAHPRMEKCRHCGEEFHTRSSYIAHLKGHKLTPAEIRLEDKDPSKVKLKVNDYFLQPGRYETHRYVCPFCMHAFKQEDLLNWHVRTTHRITPAWKGNKNEKKNRLICTQKKCRFITNSR